MPNSPDVTLCRFCTFCTNSDLSFNFTGEVTGQFANKRPGKQMWKHYITPNQANDSVRSLFCTIPASCTRMAVRGQAAAHWQPVLTRYFAPLPWTGERGVSKLSLCLCWMLSSWPLLAVGRDSFLAVSEIFTGSGCWIRPVLLLFNVQSEDAFHQWKHEVRLYPLV